MKEVVQNEDTFTLRFRTAKGVRTDFFFFGFGCLWPQDQRKAIPDPFHENIVRKAYTAKISGPYQLFYGSRSIIFCSVNGGLEDIGPLILRVNRMCSFDRLT